MTINTKLEFDGAGPNNSRLQKVIDDLAAAIGSGTAANLPGVVICPAAAPGAYTLANTGVVFETSLGVEIFRVWGTDPNDADNNSLNIYIGNQTGASQPTDNSTAGFWNVGLGGLALNSITTGASNIAIGTFSLQANTTGGANVAIGGAALNANTTGTDNCAIGTNTIGLNTTGIQNTAQGSEALFNNLTGSQNTAIGSRALSFLLSTNNNTAVGWTAGAGTNSTGDNQSSTVDTQMVFVGAICTRDASIPKTTPLSNGIAIGYNAKLVTSNTAVIGNASVTDVYAGSASALANVRAKGYYAGASAGVSFGPGAVTSITVVNGIITAIS